MRTAGRRRALAPGGAAALALVTGLAVSGGPASAAPTGPAHRHAAASGWHVQNTPDPPARSGALVADSCASATACMAVGSYQPDGVFYAPLAEAWNGASWSVQKPPAPAGAQSPQLLGVSCAAASHCVAVGNYRNKAGNIVTLAEVWNGTSWSIQPTPNPAGNQDSALASVSCPAANACTAVGYSGGFGGPDSLLTLAEAWNGTSWSIQPVSGPAGSSDASLTAVSCTSPSACTAMGGFSTSAGTTGLMAEVWNGASWSVQGAAAPKSGGGSFLAGVACSAPGVCTAVGSTFTKPDNTGSSASKTLAEAEP